MGKRYVTRSRYIAELDMDTVDVGQAMTVFETVYPASRPIGLLDASGAPLFVEECMEQIGFIHRD